MAGSTGVAPAYVDLESTRSHCDPPPAFQMAIRDTVWLSPVHIIITVWDCLPEEIWING